jgi:hypothetical protein
MLPTWFSRLQASTNPLTSAGELGLSALKLVEPRDGAFALMIGLQRQLAPLAMTMRRLEWSFSCCSKPLWSR